MRCREHYRAKLVVQHIVELWRCLSVGYAVNARLYEQFCRVQCENGNEELYTR